MPRRYVELFAGAGGMSRGLEAAGWQAVAHAEIEPHARAVLRQHWPEVPLHGDVTQVDWTQYAGQIQLVAGGSPCQDLSLAGKRAGLAGARSGLFYELLRAWDETGATYCLWENVDGARSSNHGGDFAAVLSAFVGTALLVPSDGWRSSGVAAGSTGVAAWRVLDLQHFGPPQRRRRLFVVAARTGGVDPAEVLALSEGLCRHPSPRQQQRKGAAASFRGGASGGIGVTIGIDGEKNANLELMGTLNTGSKSGSGQQPSVVAFDNMPNVMDDGGVNTLTTEGMRNPTAVVQTLVVGGRDKGAGDSYDNTPVVVQQRCASQCITGSVTHTLTHEGADAGEDGTGRGTPITVQELFTKQQYGAYTESTDVSSTIGARDHAANNVDIAVVGTLDVHDSTKWGSHQLVAQDKAMVTAGRPRRLTPLECERLMSWPDYWTATGRAEDGSIYALSDTARYRLCGNGVGSVCAAWIGSRIP